MVSGMVSCRPGASQPGTPPPATRAVVVAVGSFNFGLPQTMIDSFRGSSPASEKTVAKHCRNFARICEEMVLAGELDILFGCEVGGCREGFHCQRIDVRDILEKPFGPTVSVTSIDNYIAVTGFQNSSCFLHGTSRKVTCLGDRFDAAITHYDILPGGASQPAAHVIVGNLFIVGGSKDKPPKLATRQRIVCELRNELEKCPVPDLQVPVVRLIVGDDNLSTDEARQALRQETDMDPLWEVFPAREEGRGDHVAVNGATASVIPIPIGKSFGDRGMRPDQHDAVAVLLKIGDDSQPAKEETDSEADRGTYSRLNLDAETNMGDENSWRRMKADHSPCSQIDPECNVEGSDEPESRMHPRAVKLQEVNSAQTAGADSKYREQLLRAYRFLQEAVGCVVAMDELMNRPGSEPLRDLLKHPRAVQLQELKSAQTALALVTELCHKEGVALPAQAVAAKRSASECSSGGGAVVCEATGAAGQSAAELLMDDRGRRCRALRGRRCFVRR